MKKFFLDFHSKSKEKRYSFYDFLIIIFISSIISELIKFVL